MTSATKKETPVSDQLPTETWVEPINPEPVAAEPEIAPKDIKGIKYLGSADIKIFSAEDLVRLGAENPKGPLEWNPRNLHIVPSSEWNASTRDAVLADSDFVGV